MPNRRLPPNEAAPLLDQGFAYVDVRSPAEFADGHPPGAQNLPLGPDFPAAFAAQFPAKDAKVVVGCKMGGRSTRAVDALAAAGYSELVNMLGGFDQWAALGLPVKK